jgi:hypothetical protein
MSTNQNDRARVREIAHEYFVRGFEAEMARSRALDSKTANLMGFTSVLTGLMIPFSAIAQGELADLMKSVPTVKYSVDILFIGGVLLFFLALLCFYQSLRVRGYKEPLRYKPEDLTGWESLGGEGLRVMLTKKYQQFWQHNKVQNDLKARWTQRGFTVLVLGGGVVVLSVCVIIGMFIMKA